MENEIYSDIKSKMIKTIEHYSHEVAIIRTGRASSDILDTIKGDYYGTLSPLKNIVVNLEKSVAPNQFQRPESWTPKEKKKFWLSLLMNRIEGVIVVSFASTIGATFAMLISRYFLCHL